MSSQLLEATKSPQFVRDYLEALDYTNPEAVALLEFLPPEFRGKDWVRLLAHFCVRDGLKYGETTAEPLRSVFLALAPNGVNTCASTEALYWLPVYKYDDETAESGEARAVARSACDYAERLRLERNLQWFHPSRALAEAVRCLLRGWQDDGEIAHYEDGNVWKCVECAEWSEDTIVSYDTERTFCVDCGEGLLNYSEYSGEWYEHDWNMPEDDRNEQDRIHEHPLYGFNKETGVRFGDSETGTFYGFELEIEQAQASNDWDDELSVLPKNGLWLFHFDGSLNNGLELVTEPMSGDFIREKLDLTPLDKLRESGWRSWNTSTCGLHVHVSRAGFAGDVHLFAFAQFIYRNSAQMIKLAGRHSQQYATFNESERPALALDVKKRADFARRYVAVNFQPDKTVECRFFKGSLNTSRVRSALELVSGVVEYSRALTVRDLNEGALDWSRFVAYLNQTPDYFPNLLNLIKRKGL